MSLRLELETHARPAALDALREEWVRLHDRVGQGLPFSTPEWARAWWNHFAREERRLRDELRLVVLREPGGQARAIAPLMLTERPARGPLRLRSLQFLGADPHLTEVRGLLAGEDDESAAALRVCEHFERSDGAWDWLVLGGLRGPDDALAPLLADGRGSWAAPTPAYVLDLPPTWNELRARLRRNVRESLRKCYNSLARAGHAFRLEVAESPAEVAAALPRFLDLHRLRALVPGGVPHADHFAARPARRFLAEVCDLLARRRAVRVFTLCVAGAPVAARVGFVFGPRLYLYYSGYDPAWADYSVMTTTLAETLAWAMASGVRSANLSTGRDVSKTRWGPREVVYRELTRVRAGLRPRLAHAAFVRAFQARDHPLLRFLSRRVE